MAVVSRSCVRGENVSAVLPYGVMWEVDVKGWTPLAAPGMAFISLVATKEAFG